MLCKACFRFNRSTDLVLLKFDTSLGVPYQEKYRRISTDLQNLNKLRTTQMQLVDLQLNTVLTGITVRFGLNLDSVWMYVSMPWYCLSKRYIITVTIYCVAWNLWGSLISRIADVFVFSGNKFLRIWIADVTIGNKFRRFFCNFSLAFDVQNLFKVYIKRQYLFQLKSL